MTNAEVPGWQGDIIKRAEGNAKQQFAVATIDDGTQQLRLDVGEQLQILPILKFMTNLSTKIDTEGGRGMRIALHALAGKVTNNHYEAAMAHTHFKTVKDIYALYDDDNHPFLALGLGVVILNSLYGELHIVMPLDRVNPKQKIGYVAQPCNTPDDVADFILDFMLANRYQRELKEAENPHGVHNIVDMGHAVYFRFGEVFAPEVLPK